VIPLNEITGEIIGFDDLSWVVTAYLLASTATTPLWGKLGNLYGRKTLFQILLAMLQRLANNSLDAANRNVMSRL